jgi:moderate conductance mechanosensitive channel
MVEWLPGDLEFLNYSIVRILFVIAGVFIIQFIVNRFVGQVVERVIQSHHYKSKHEERQREDTLIAIFRTITTVVLWVIAAVVILQELGFNIAALATGAGLLGIVVGFGAQNMIKDFLSGFFIILENQYRIGDVVTIGGHSGLVEHISIRMTKLRDLDGSVFFVPNGEIKTVKNMTLEYSGVLLDVGVSYDTDLNEAEKVINEVGKQLADDPDWHERIIEPIAFLRVESFGDSSVTLRALGKVTPIEQWSVAGEYRRRLKKAFERAKIEIPFQQVVLHQSKSK